MKTFLSQLIALLALTFYSFGCSSPALIAGAGTTGYKTAVDKRSFGTIVDDSIISSKVKSKLFSDDFVKSRHIDVDVLRGVVYLTGAIESTSQKRMAADIARGVEGVRKVVNQLIVGSLTAGEILDDAVLSSKIKTELIKTDGIKSTNIDVDTTKGQVTLTGIVSSYQEKNKILYVVEKMIGNRPLIDNIKVSR